MAHALDSLFAPIGLDAFVTRYLGRKAVQLHPLDESVKWDEALLAELARELRADVAWRDADPVSESRFLLQRSGQSECTVGEDRFELQAGDVLYVPAHVDLRVDAAGDARLGWVSVRLATGADLLRLMIDAVGGVEQVRAELPLCAGPAELSEHLRRMRRVVVHALRAPQLLLEYARHVDDAGIARGVSGRVFEDDMGDEWRIAPAGDRRLQVWRAEAGEIYVGPRSRPVLFAEAASGPLQFLMERAPVTIGEFRTAFADWWDDGQLRGFLRKTTESGLFTMCYGDVARRSAAEAAREREAVTARGWLPVSIGFDTRAPLITEAAVRWMELGDQGLDDPFVKNTEERLRTQAKPVREIDTGLETLERIGGWLPEVRPRGLIFHVSHCGSTLISNALKTAEDVVVASEPRALSMLVRPYLFPMGKFLEQHWDERRQRLIQALLNLLATYRTGEAQPLVVKFPSVAMLSIAMLRRYYPDVPFLIVIREPLEVMVANKPGRGWMQLRSAPASGMEIFGWRELRGSVETMPDEEFSARVLGSFYESAEANLGGRTMVLDYTQLTAARMVQIGEFFGVGVTAGERLDAVMNTSAKDPEQKQVYRDDRAKKQWMASVMMRSTAEVYAAAGYRRLLAAALQR